jgi:hypothetical protein
MRPGSAGGQQYKGAFNRTEHRATSRWSVFFPPLDASPRLSVHLSSHLFNFRDAPLLSGWFMSALALLHRRSGCLSLSEPGLSGAFMSVNFTKRPPTWIVIEKSASPTLGRYESDQSSLFNSISVREDTLENHKTCLGVLAIILGHIYLSDFDVNN